MAASLLIVQMNLDRWIALCGLIGTLIGVALAIYYARQVEKRRGPTFVVSPRKIILSSAHLYALTDFSVAYRGEIVGKCGLTEVIVYFFNSGALPILKEDVLTPFEIEFPIDCAVLDCAVTKQNRDVVGFSASAVANRVVLDFEVLEPNDGGTVRVVYDGPGDVKMEFGGSCIGASNPTVLPSDNVYFLKPFDRIKPFLMMPVLAVVAGVAALILVLAMAGGAWLFRRLFGQDNVQVAFLVLALATVVVVIGGEMYKRYTAKVVPPNIH